MFMYISYKTDLTLLLCFAGIISLWSLLKSMEALNIVIGKVYPDIFQMFHHDVVGVTAAQVIEIHPKLYKDITMATPFITTQRPAHLGYKSTSNYIELIGKSNSFLYMKIQRSTGFIDMKTKKGAPVPDEIKAVYDKAKDPAAKPVFIDQPKAPDNALKYQMVIENTDADILYHTNQTSYFRYCFNAAADACAKNELSNFHGDFFIYRVSKAGILYKRESHPGDDMEITFWENEESKLTLHFILKVNDILIAVVNLTFFPETNFHSVKL